MATDPRQEQIMQLAQVIRQMGMPNPNTRTTDIMGPPPGGYQQTFLERPSDMPDDLWNKYLARISATNQTVNLRPSGPLTSTTEEQWQQQLQPYGPGVQGPASPPTWSNGQDPGWAPGTKPGQGGRPQQLQPYGPQVGGNVSTQYGRQGYTEDDYFQMAERYRTDPAYKKQMDVSDYLRNAKQQEGWKSEWDAYVPTITGFLEGKIKDPRNPFEEGWQTKLRVRPIAIPEAVWNEMSNFQNKIGGIGQYRQQNPFDPYSQPFTMYTGLEPSPYTPGTQKFPGGTPQNPYAGTQTGGQYGQGGQSPSVLSDLARKNAIRRQVLAKLMGRPTGANSLMDLLGQQQPY